MADGGITVQKFMVAETEADAVKIAQDFSKF